MKNLFLLFTAIAILHSCAEESFEQAEQLQGKWSEIDLLEDHPQLFTELIYQFGPGNKYVVERLVIDAGNNELLGYRYKATGTYELKRDRLKLHQLEVYAHDDLKGLYSDLSDMQLSKKSEKNEWNFSFENSFKVLNFHYDPCKDFSDCILGQSFIRKMQ